MYIVLSWIGPSIINRFSELEYHCNLYEFCHHFYISRASPDGTKYVLSAIIKTPVCVRVTSAFLSVTSELLELSLMYVINDIAVCTY
jgi:hypothetical protein